MYIFCTSKVIKLYCVQFTISCQNYVNSADFLYVVLFTALKQAKNFNIRSF